MKRAPASIPNRGRAILVAVAILYVIGLLCIYATEVVRPGFPINTVKQIITMLVGCVVSLIVLRIGYGWCARYAYVVFAIAVLALVPLVIARYVPFGTFIPCRRGAYRWINMRVFQLQPSEFMKVAYIIALAAYLRYRKNQRTLRGLLVPLSASLVPMFLILLEPDLGTVLLIMPVLFLMLYAAGARLRHFIVLGLAAVAVAPLFWRQLQPYQRSRVLGVLLQSDALRSRIENEPARYAFLATRRQAREWAVSSGMQLVRSKAALGSGGVTGHGWATGTFIEYNFLPDKHNDFIFALIGHQWGLVGCLLVLVCYAIIVLAGLDIAAVTTDPFARLLAVGVVGLIATQVTINVGMTIGLMPITGMTLPFVSYGGSSLLANMIGIALLLSVSRHRPFLLAARAFDFERTSQPDAPIRPEPALHH